MECVKSTLFMLVSQTVRNDLVKRHVKEALSFTIALSILSGASLYLFSIWFTCLSIWLRFLIDNKINLQNSSISITAGCGSQGFSKGDTFSTCRTMPKGTICNLSASFQKKILIFFF